MRPLPRLRSVAEKAREGTLKLHFYLESIIFLSTDTPHGTVPKQNAMISELKTSEKTMTACGFCPH